MNTVLPGGGIPAGGIDWVAHWTDLVTRRRVIIEALAGQGPQARFWDARADRFAQRARATDPKTDPLTLALLAMAKQSDTLLDVGAGTGRYALPLASAVTRVTAVEPSAAMRGQMEQAIADGGVENVTVVPSAWEDAIAEPHDLVLCSNVLYPIADVVPFITKLDTHALRICTIIIRVDQMGAMIDPLWPQIWGQSRPAEPGLLDLYNLLFAIGIRANVRLAHRAAAQDYATFDDALQQARNQLFMPADQHQHDDTTRAFLAKTLIPSGDGYAAPASPQYALVWWEKS